MVDRTGKYRGLLTAGERGNQNARKGNIWKKAIKRALARSSGSTVHDGLDRLADKMVAAALNGDPWAFKEIGERMDGKAAQSTEVTIHQGRSRVEELTDEQLADIVLRGREGTASAPAGTPEPPEIH